MVLVMLDVLDWQLLNLLIVGCVCICTCVRAHACTCLFICDTFSI